MKEKEIILSSDNLTFEDEEVGSSGYSDGLLLYSYHAWMETNVVEVSAAGDIEGDVDIPSEVIINKIKYKVIGIYSFYGCRHITSVKIPPTVYRLNEIAFQNCSGLESIVVAEGNHFMNSHNNCNAIISNSSNTLLVGCKKTIIPNDVTTIYNYAFKGCSGLEAIDVPEKVEYIGDWAFADCSNLRSIFIPSNLVQIGNGAFAGCSGLEQIIVSNSNKIYDSRNNCNAIIETGTNKLLIGSKTTIIPNSVNSIGENAFMNNKSLTRMVIPESVTTIGRGAFDGCINMTFISIPSSVKSIGRFAFSGCGFESIVIPKGVKQLDSAFSYCCQLKSIRVEEGNSIYDSRNNSNAIIETANNRLILGCKTTVIPESVTSIGNGAFSNQEDITTLTIPENIVEIGQGAFMRCKNLISVYSYIKDPRKCLVHLSAFVGHKDTAILYVPMGTVKIYRASKDGWRDFKEIREFEIDAIKQ